MKNKSGQLKSTPETDAVRAYEGNWDTKALRMTAHARKLERERDEAREEAGHWKTEYEIVVDRLRGRKHPRDNGIIADDEIIPKLERECDEAREERDIARLETEEINQELVNARKQIEGLNNFANERYEEIQSVRKERDEAREAIIATLEENRHLADGDDCTLAKLKSVVP